MSILPSPIRPELALPASLGGFAVRLLSPDDLEAIVALRREALACLTHPDAYVVEDDETGFLLQHCGAGGVTVGLFEGQILVAYAAVGFPAMDHPDNLGSHLGFAPERLGTVAHIASCMVRPAYRGHGLQGTLLKARFALALAYGRRHCLAMVSLHNHPSRHNMLKQAMRIRWAGELRCGSHLLRRQVLHLDLRGRSDGAGPVEHWLGSDDLDAQRALLSAGWIGVADRYASCGSAELGFATCSP
ncbi:GNAT family N-acetyltransferase [Chitinimonas lacunae]|uniref:GNAT family N-acetyltransferase n=1 Tax=Chitinimonas lacunae TaxID=1963018 RepID=A0ABV8MQ69_9NEIS